VEGFSILSSQLASGAFLVDLVAFMRGSTMLGRSLFVWTCISA
jgi:hypothetical protein